jgi:catechol 2,3-dioxygenase-like lactoylglutathione lyase family enzyme
MLRLHRGSDQGIHWREPVGSGETLRPLTNQREVTVTSTDIRTDTATEAQVGTVDFKLEAVTLPVSDVDRAKAFYLSLGWRLDADIAREGFRVVQLTPPHSQCSIHFGIGLIPDGSAPVQRMLLVVADIEEARADLISRGVAVSEAYHNTEDGQASGPDPNHGTYQSYAAFSDPDGNGWLLQEITTRFPGRVWED